MSRRKSLAFRKPCGRIRSIPSAEILSPTEMKRLFDGAVLGLRDQAWATTAGRLFLVGKLTSTQFSTARRWSELTASYSIACGSPQQPHSMPLEVGIKGAPVDPDTAGGLRQARADTRAMTAFLEGKSVLKLAGRTVEDVVDAVVIHDQMPAGLYQLDALKTGLQSLSAAWAAKRKPRFAR
jgi:hypothetical protein